MKRITSFLAVIAVVATMSACSSGGIIDLGSQTRATNDAKAALKLSADLYDNAMRIMGNRYQLGTCSEACKTRSIELANTYLTAARGMKTALDRGSIDISSDYQVIYDVITQLTALLQDQAGANVRPNTLPTPATLSRAVARPRGLLIWPPAATPPSLRTTDHVYGVNR